MVKRKKDPIERPLLQEGIVGCNRGGRDGDERMGIDDTIMRGGKVRRDGGGENGMGDDMAKGMVVVFVVVGGHGH